MLFLVLSIQLSEFNSALMRVHYTTRTKCKRSFRNFENFLWENSLTFCWLYDIICLCKTDKLEEYTETDTFETSLGGWPLSVVFLSSSPQLMHITVSNRINIPLSITSLQSVAGILLVACCKKRRRQKVTPSLSNPLYAAWGESNPSAETVTTSHKSRKPERRSRIFYPEMELIPIWLVRRHWEQGSPWRISWWSNIRLFGANSKRKPHP